MNDVLSQDISMENRKLLKLTGVTKIETLNPYEFQLVTVLGNLSIKGNDLEMKSFDIDKGNIIIVGTIDAIAYSQKTQIKKNKGFIQKLFK